MGQTHYEFIEGGRPAAYCTTFGGAERYCEVYGERVEEVLEYIEDIRRRGRYIFSGRRWIWDPEKGKLIKQET